MGEGREANVGKKLFVFYSVSKGDLLQADLRCRPHCECISDNSKFLNDKKVWNSGLKSGKIVLKLNTLFNWQLIIIPTVNL